LKNTPKVKRSGKVKGKDHVYEQGLPTCLSVRLATKLFKLCYLPLSSVGWSYLAIAGGAIKTGPYEAVCQKGLREFIRAASLPQLRCVNVSYVSLTFLFLSTFSILRKRCWSCIQMLKINEKQSRKNSNEVILC